MFSYRDLPLNTKTVNPKFKNVSLFYKAGRVKSDANSGRCSC